MTSVIIGKIERKKIDLYRVKINKVSKQDFDNLDDAFAFAKKHAIGIMNTNEVQAAAIQYERIDKRASYIIWERITKDDETSILKYEESAYDYVETHSAFFPKRLTNRMLNERYYSFHDFTRVNVLTSNRRAIFRILLGIATLLLTVLYFFYTLHGINMSDEAKLRFPSDDRAILTTYAIIISVLGTLITSASIFSYAYPLYKINKMKGHFDDIDWRKLNKYRNIAKIVSISIALAFFAISIHYFIILKNDHAIFGNPTTNELGAVFLVSYIYLALISLIVINGLVNTIHNLLLFRKNAPKYFTDSEIEMYKQWLKYKTPRVIYKTDEEYFLLPLEKSNDIVQAKKVMYSEVLRTSDDSELKQYKNKAISHYKVALKEYRNAQKQSGDM